MDLPLGQLQVRHVRSHDKDLAVHRDMVAALTDSDGGGVAHDKRLPVDVEENAGEGLTGLESEHHLAPESGAEEPLHVVASPLVS